MRLTDLASSDTTPAAPLQARDPLIAGLTSDSRAVKPGFLFAALPGSKADGRAFVADAVAREECDFRASRKGADSDG